MMTWTLKMNGFSFFPQLSKVLKRQSVEGVAVEETLVCGADFCVADHHRILADNIALFRSTHDTLRNHTTTVDNEATGIGLRVNTPKARSCVLDAF